MHHGEKSREELLQEIARLEERIAELEKAEEKWKLQAEEALRVSEAKYCTIFDLSPVSLWEEDISLVRKALGRLKAAGVQDFGQYFDERQDFVTRIMHMVKIIDVNEATLTLYGARSKEEVIGSLDRILLPESLKTFKEFLIAIAEGRNFFKTETVNRTLQGETIHLLLTAMIPPEDSSYRNLLIGIVDITDRKKLERELLKIQKLESLGLLAGGIAHDFNNLLTAIVGNISLGKMNVLPGDKVYRWLDEAEKASLRAKGLTQQLLTFSKGGAPVKKVLALGELVRESAGFTVRGSKVRCEYYIPPDLWTVEADEGQISQVIHNLIINAEQAMPDGGTIRVHCCNSVVSPESVLPLKSGRYIKISIQDQGIGIPPDYLGKIFDPYFTTKQKGSGLGLATAHAIINKHGGHITVESALRVGATFHLYLPSSSREVCSGRKREKPLIGHGKVLIMDDEEAVRNIAGEILRDFGYEARFASDGAEAVSLYEQAKKADRGFDAVILDLTIPGGMGGLEALRKLQEIDPLVRAIVSSGYSIDPVLKEYRKYGFKGAVVKPYRVEELNKEVYEVVHGIR
ncbi:MAG: response regulator [Alphaproteobacteria bacterium]|uniref:histidine kinase n=1 Tax=Candidatus Nitrobium versatile TaxID=2884831 RepID=A0A953J4R5_9BACT|nr:response regulator [Candidatus Nitrobium versatile]